MEFLLIHGHRPPFRIGSILYRGFILSQNLHKCNTFDTKHHVRIPIFCAHDECKKGKPMLVMSLPFGSSRLDAARTGFRSVSSRFLDLNDHRLFRTPNGHRNPCSTMIHEFLPPFVLMNQLHTTPEDYMKPLLPFLLYHTL